MGAGVFRQIYAASRGGPAEHRQVEVDYGIAVGIEAVAGLACLDLYDRMYCRGLDAQFFGYLAVVGFGDRAVVRCVGRFGKKGRMDRVAVEDHDLAVERVGEYLLQF